MKILVVDDDDFLRALVKKALLSQGYKVMTSSNGLDAMGKLKNFSFDAIVTDNVIPYGGALPISEYLHQNAPQLPVLVISGGMSPSARLEDSSASIPARHILYKPFKKDELLAALDSAVTAAA